MAGQLTGRSRFGFKIVWIAVQCCALHLNDLKGYRTLALPTSSRETRAELEKMTVKVLKEKLREKGKKVSGRKAELIARLTQQDLQGPTETQAKAVWVQQLREDCARQRLPKFKSRFFLRACIGFRSCSRRCPSI